MTDTAAPALVVIDAQQGFDDPTWGTPNNARCDDHIGELVAVWQQRGHPIVLVRHDSVSPGSPLRPGQPGNAFRPVLDGVGGDVVITKQVNSAFHGEPDLHAWLRAHGIGSIVLCGIQTNMCVETTARVGGNLGYDVTVAIDATRTFDLAGPDGSVLSADELARVTTVNLHGGRFARIATTADVVAGRPPPP